MSQTLQFITAAPAITEPLAIKDSGDITRFNEASARNLEDMRDLSVWLNSDFIPRANELVEPLNAVSVRLTDVVRVAGSVDVLDTLAPHVDAVDTLAPHVDAIDTLSGAVALFSSVNDNLAAILDAPNQASIATQKATVATEQATIAMQKADEASTSAADAGASRDGAGESAETATTQAGIATERAAIAMQKADEASASAASALSSKQSVDGVKSELIAIAGGDVVLSTDPRLSDARTPTAHAASHNADGSDALTSFSGELRDVGELHQPLGSISGTVTVDLSLGNSVSATITAATTLVFTGAVSGACRTVLLTLTNGGAYTVTWPSTIKWPGDTAPILTESGTDLIILSTSDGGTTWRGVATTGYAG